MQPAAKKLSPCSVARAFLKLLLVVLTIAADFSASAAPDALTNTVVISGTDTTLQQRGYAICSADFKLYLWLSDCGYVPMKS